MSRVMSAGSYLSATAPATDITGTAFTVAAWVRPLGSGRVVSRWATTRWLLEIATAKAQLAIFGGGFDVATGATTLDTTNGVWYHLCGTVDASNVKIYLNGAQDGSVARTQTMSSQTQDIGIGADVGGASPIAARIADVAVWDATLSVAEILALAKGASPTLIRRDHLKAHWPLWGAGLPEPNLSGNTGNAGQNGTVAAGDHSPSGLYVPQGA